MAILSRKELKKLDEYFRALNYLSVAQLYLLDNPLLRRELRSTDIKPNVVGHWGTVPGQNFVYMHLNRLIKKYNLNTIILKYVIITHTTNVLSKISIFFKLSNSLLNSSI